jgi:hypothetical protein
MKATIGPDGSVAIPPEYRDADAILPGQPCEIERIGRGEYRVRVSPPQQRRPLVDVLRDCPEKDFFRPINWIETTDDIEPVSFL